MAARIPRTRRGEMLGGLLIWMESISEAIMEKRNGEIWQKCLTTCLVENVVRLSQTLYRNKYNKARDVPY